MFHHAGPPKKSPFFAAWKRCCVGLSAALLAANAAPLQAQPEQPAAVRYAEVQRRPITETVELPGTIVSQTVSTVASETAGLVLEFLVREGDRVEAGQLLARLRKDRLELQLQAVEAQLEEDRTRRRQAEVKWKRTQELFEKHVLSKQELDDSLFEFEALGKRIQRVEAEIARLKDDIARAEIHAPFAGVVVAEHTQIGEWLEEGGEVIDLLSVANLEALVPVPERYFGNLNRGTRAAIRFESLPELQIEAPITSVIPRADPQARTFPLKIRIPRPDRRLGVGMVCQVTLTLGSAYPALVIPKDALVQEGAEEAVYVINGRNQVERATVRSGNGYGSWIEIRRGLQEGQKVITRGNERLRPGQFVVAEPQEYKFP